MAGVNKVILLGNLGRDPELRYTKGGTAVCQLNLATSRSFTDRDGERREETEWHRVTVWGKQGENCERFLSKGRQVYLEGRLQTRSYEDKDGNKRWSTEVIADRVQFIGGRGEGGGGGRGEGGGGGRGEGGGGGRGEGGGGGRGEGGGGGGGGGRGGGGGNEPPPFDDSYVPADPGDDDIPF